MLARVLGFVLVGRPPSPLGVAGSNEVPLVDEANLAAGATFADEAILADEAEVEAEAEAMPKNL